MDLLNLPECETDGRLFGKAEKLCQLQIRGLLRRSVIQEALQHGEQVQRRPCFFI